MNQVTSRRAHRLTYAMILSLCVVNAQDFESIQKVVDEIIETFCYTPCSNGYSGNEVIPGTKCQWYHHCLVGIPTNIIECGDGLWYDPANDRCDTQIEGQPIDCPPDPKCPTMPPTESPSASPEVNPTTETPTLNPMATPTMKPTNMQTAAPTKNIPPPTSRPTSAAPTIGGKAIPYIESKRDLIEKMVLVSYDGISGAAYSSKQYTYSSLIQSLKVMGVDGFGADFKFLLYEFDSDKWIHGLVNLAAFLANCMVESVQYDACDELNWQNSEGKYPISNSCGQEGRSYQDENCALGTTEFMSCDVDSNMYVTAVTKGTQDRAPPPLKCRPGTGDGNFVGYWDFSTGREVSNAEYVNVAGRTDIEGCCWWGRGALSTRGVCNIGKINYFLGKRGADAGRTTLYPTLDFCKYPEVTCTGANGDLLRWTTALFEWSERVQRYEVLPSLADGNGWNFEDHLEQFIKGGMSSDSFIMDISSILSRGCHKSGCSELQVRMLDERKFNFFMIINDIFDLKSELDRPRPTSEPTQQPTGRPTYSVLMEPVVVPIQPPVSVSDGLPPQQERITMQPVTPNPTRIQQIISPAAPTESNQVIPLPVAQPQQPPPDNFVNDATSLPTYGDSTDDGQLIVIEGNFASKVLAKWAFQLNLLAVTITLHYHLM